MRQLESIITSLRSENKKLKKEMRMGKARKSRYELLYIQRRRF